MDIEWDKIKAKINERKHGVSFSDAAVVMNDPMSVTIDDDVVVDDEERFVSIGMDGQGRILIVVYTYRGKSSIRIISARRATNNERKQYGG
ncbi:MAG: BrnT family toxin [Magnetococcales bacterium]|nr:BrnT family toxin [Magnetococcales bacterium]